MFGIVEGTNKRDRRMDDTVSWCKAWIQELNSLVWDCRRWQRNKREAKDTNGCWSLGLWKKDKFMITSTFSYWMKSWVISHCIHYGSFSGSCYCHFSYKSSQNWFRWHISVNIHIFSFCSAKLL